MSAGKSTSLLQVAHNYESLGKLVRVFTAKVDTRFGVGRVSSRLGISRPAELFFDELDFLVEVNNSRIPDCILIDEAQFLSARQVIELHKIANLQDVPVICYGLRTDFKGYPFPGSAMLLSLADKLEELVTLCGCGRKATMSIRLSDSGHRLTEGDQVGIGDTNYRQVCGACFRAQPQE